MPDLFALQVFDSVFDSAVTIPLGRLIIVGSSSKIASLVGTLNRR